MDVVAAVAEAGDDPVGVAEAAGLELDVDLYLIEVELGGEALVGDLEDTSDQACPTPSMKPVSGVLIHACALATLNRGTIFRIAESMSWRSMLASGVLLLTVVVGVRMLYPSHSSILLHS